MNPPIYACNKYSPTDTRNIDQNLGRIDEEKGAKNPPGKTTILFTANKPLSLSLIYTQLKLRGLEVEGGVDEIRSFNYMPPGTLGIPKGRIIRMQVAKKTVACPMPERQNDDPPTKPQTIGQVYDGTVQYGENGKQIGKLKMLVPYYDASKNYDEDTKQWMKDVSKQTTARAIFIELQKAGIIKKDAVYSDKDPGSIGQKIASKLKDDEKDNSYYLYFFIEELMDLLTSFNLLTDSDKPVGEALSGFTVRYIKNEPVNVSATNKTKSEIARMTLDQFLSYVEYKYTRDGQSLLCGNEALQREFEADVRTWMEANLTGAFDENNRQILLRQDFVVTPRNIHLLSRDGQGKYRVDCKRAVQIMKQIGTKAGLITEYYGSSMIAKDNEGRLYTLSHVQAVLYTPSGDYAIANSGPKILGRTNVWSKEERQKLAHDLLLIDLGKEAKIINPEGGIDKLNNVSVLLQNNIYLTTVQLGINQEYTFYGHTQRFMQNIDKQTVQSAKHRLARIDQQIQDMRKIIGLADQIKEWPLTITDPSHDDLVFKNKQQLIDYLNERMNKYTEWKGEIAGKLNDRERALYGRMEFGSGTLDRAAAEVKRLAVRGEKVVKQGAKEAKRLARRGAQGVEEQLNITATGAKEAAKQVKEATKRANSAVTDAAKGAKGFIRRQASSVLRFFGFGKK